MQKVDLRWLVVLIIVLLVLSTTIVFNGIQNSGKKGQGKEIIRVPTGEEFKPLAPQVIIFGQWFDNKSSIQAFNLGNGERRVLANLPLDVKRVTVLKDDKLIYIGGVSDTTDHGKNISLYLINNKSIKEIYTASDGFGIDDYFVSPNNKYIAIWEVQFLPNTAVLLGGASKVKVIDIDSGSVYTIYDEIQSENIPVHYPIAVFNNGDVYCDQFLPNSGAGWAYGLSVSSIDGKIKEELANMQNGTFGTQPKLSSEGSYLAFVGYEGVDGAAEVGGFRKALLLPNTVEIFDINTKQRIKVIGNELNTTYIGANWDEGSGNLIFIKTSKNENSTGIYSYNIADKTINKIDIGQDIGQNQTISFVSSLGQGKILLGNQDNSDSAKGNLGKGYASPYTNFIVYSKDINDVVPDLGGLMQYIGIMPSSSFSSVSSVEGSSSSTTCEGYKNLQLCPFYLKPKMANKREEQQTKQPANKRKPFCRDLATERCLQMGYAKNTIEYNDCWYNEFHYPQLDREACLDSPLYLYGEEGQLVRVKVGTYIYDSNAEYNDVYDVILGQEGKLFVAGKEFDSLDYNYTPGVKHFVPPAYGKVVSKAEVEEALKDYAKNLELNKKETADLINYGKDKIDRPYVFITFFDQKQSEKILPLFFDPIPDVYRNIVFYFKQYQDKPSFIPSKPVFSEIPVRDGLTAVEISAIVE